MAVSKQSPQPLYVLRGLDSAVHSVRFLSSDALITGNLSGTVSIWNLKTLRTSFEQKLAHSKSVLGFIPISADEFWSHGRDGEVRMWHVREGIVENMRTVNLPTVGFCQCCSITMDGKTLVCGAWDGAGELAVLDGESGGLVAKFRPQQATPCGMAMSVLDVSDAGRPGQVLTAHEDGCVRTWDLRDTRASLSTLKTHSEPIFNCAFDGNDRRGVVAGAASSLASFSLDDAGQIGKSKSAECPSSGVTDLAVRTDSKLLVCSLTDGRIMAYSWKTLKTLAVMSHHLQTVHCIACAPAGSEHHVFAAGSKDCTVSLWSLYK